MIAATIVSVATGTSLTARCEPLEVNFCSSLGYDSVYMPNYFMQNSQSEASYVLNLIDSLDSNNQCKRLLHHLACGLALPQCAEDQRPLEPCRKTCLGKWILGCSISLCRYL